MNILNSQIGILVKVKNGFLSESSAGYCAFRLYDGWRSALTFCIWNAWGDAQG